MMLAYYAGEEGLKKLLRPMNEKEQAWMDDDNYRYGNVPDWTYTWSALYEGLMIADDIESLAEEIDRNTSHQRLDPRAIQAGEGGPWR